MAPTITSAVLTTTVVMVLSAVLIAQPATDQGRIAGFLLNQSTKQPLYGGTVRLQGATASANNYTVRSDAEGKFAFDHIQPGRYILKAERAGYVSGTYRDHGSTAISIEPGTVKADVHFELMPYGVISGRVTDEERNPTTEVQVFALRFAHAKGRRTLQSAGQPTSVDEEGRFRIANLLLGRYILSARRRSMGTPDASRETEAYVTTYAPDAVDIGEAVPLSVFAGSEATGTITLQKRRVFRVQGKVIDTDRGEPVRNFFLLLTPQGNSEFAGFGGRLSTYVKDGTFEFTGVLPGTYVTEPSNMVTIFTGPGGRETIVARSFGRYPITVDKRDLTGLEVPFKSGAIVTGILQSEAEDQSRALYSKLRKQVTAQPVIHLVAESPSGRDFKAPSKSDGTFELRDVAPERYHLGVEGLSQGEYVKSVRMGSQELAYNVVDLTAGVGAELEVVISPKAAEVLGTVRNEAGENISDAVVTLWPVSCPPSAEIQLFRNATTDPDGKFSFKGLAPGEYRILAWEDVDVDLAMDREFRKHFDGSATSLRLPGGSHESVELKLVPRDKILAVAANFQ